AMQSTSTMPCRRSSPECHSLPPSLPPFLRLPSTLYLWLPLPVLPIPALLHPYWYQIPSMKLSRGHARGR
ncbi:hypothetical protein ElyMa_004592300, partial [Elysia marginata]